MRIEGGGESARLTAPPLVDTFPPSNDFWISGFDGVRKVTTVERWARALPPQALPFGFTFTDFSQLNMFPRARRDRWGGTWKLKSFVNPGKTLKFRRAKPGW